MLVVIEVDGTIDHQTSDQFDRVLRSIAALINNLTDNSIANQIVFNHALVSLSLSMIFSVIDGINQL